MGGNVHKRLWCVGNRGAADGDGERGDAIVAHMLLPAPVQYRRVTDEAFGDRTFDLAATVELPNRLVQSNHAAGTAGQDTVINRFDLAEPNRAGNRCVCEHDFQRQFASCTRRLAWQQVLADHGHRLRASCDRISC